MTLDEMAVFLGTGRTSYYNYETGRRMPPVEMLILLSEHYDLPVEALLYDPGVRIAGPLPENRAAISREFLMIGVFRQLSPYTQGKLLAEAKSLLDDDIYR